MILVNRNFGNPVLAEVIGDMFRGSTDTSGAKVEKVNNTNSFNEFSIKDIITFKENVSDK